MKKRLDQELVRLNLVPTRSQAESYIKLGYVEVNGKPVTKSGALVNESDKISLTVQEQYVSRAGMKLASVAEILHLDFNDKVVLDIGSSTGGFTDYALKRGAKKVIAVDVGTNQLHPSLRINPKIEIHEQTDIRDFTSKDRIDLVLADLSFISLREILPHVSKLMTSGSHLIAMVKPQFEAGKQQINRGVIKNDKMRREVLKDFENWVQKLFVIADKADSKVSGAKGNVERFYLLKPVSRRP